MRTYLIDSMAGSHESPKLMVREDIGYVDTALAVEAIAEEGVSWKLKRSQGSPSTRGGLLSALVLLSNGLKE